MTDKSVTVPELILLIGTRVALGMGIGMLVADKLSPEARRGAGAALLAVGGLSTIPIAMSIMCKPKGEAA